MDVSTIYICINSVVLDPLAQLYLPRSTCQCQCKCLDIAVTSLEVALDWRDRIVQILDVCFTWSGCQEGVRREPRGCQEHVERAWGEKKDSARSQKSHRRLWRVCQEGVKRLSRGCEEDLKRSDKRGTLPRGCLDSWCWGCVERVSSLRGCQEVTRTCSAHEWHPLVTVSHMSDKTWSLSWAWAFCQEVQCAERVSRGCQEL